jgi:hypothetical protein
LLAAGLYRVVTIYTTHQSCIEIGATPSAGLGVVGGDGDVTRVVGAMKRRR